MFPATGQRLYMVHMLLLPFLPITALIVQVTCDWLNRVEMKYLVLLIRWASVAREVPSREVESSILKRKT